MEYFDICVWGNALDYQWCYSHSVDTCTDEHNGNYVQQRVSVPTSAVNSGDADIYIGCYLNGVEYSCL